MSFTIYDEHGRDVTSIVDFIVNQNGNVNTYLAAPELLEALKWYVENDDVNEGDPENEFWTDGLNRARQAISKATGDDQAAS